MLKIVARIDRGNLHNKSFLCTFAPLRKVDNTGTIKSTKRNCYKKISEA
jgi:hypothetical protein